MVAPPSRTGTTTLTGGSSGTDRLRGCQPRGDPCQTLGAPAIAFEGVGQVLAALVLDGEHAGVAGGAQRRRERVEPVARAREQRLHVVALPVAAQETRHREWPA